MFVGNSIKLKIGMLSKYIGGVYKMLGSMFGTGNELKDEIIAATNAVSNGDTSVRITTELTGIDKEVADSFNAMLDAMESKEEVLTDEVLNLVNAAVEGRLDTRADASKFDGNNKKIVQGVNDTLDAVIGPLNVAAEYVDRISKGDIPDKITDDYNGDFNEIKNNLNVCIGAIDELVDDAAALSKAAVEGRLDTRADASKHGGDFRAIVNGVNETLDAVIGPLNVAAEYVDR
ncbi:MAG: methyl-accepting chemotaxis protein, partial [Methanosarcinales archaeon]|nr:methyl-accepting chemotaxis protein [Methanosarcinales archaeon]